MWCSTDDRLVDSILDQMRATQTNPIDLAEMAGIRPSNLFRIINRVYSPPLYVYERIANVLNLKISIYL